MKLILLASVATLVAAAPGAPSRSSKSSSLSKTVKAEDNSEANGQGSGGLLGLGLNLLNDVTLLGMSDGTNNKGDSNASKNFLSKYTKRGDRSSSSSKTSVDAQDNSEANGNGKGGLLGLGLNLLNGDTILGMSEGTNNKGTGNATKNFLARRGERGGSRSDTKKTAIKAEDNSEANGNGKGGLLGLGLNLLNGDTILGMSDGTNNKGDANASKSFLKKRGNRYSSSKKTAIKAEDNSQANGVGKGGLIGIGANALNGDSILGLSQGTNSRGDGNASKNFLA